MAHVEDRWYRAVQRSDGRTEREKTPLFGKGNRYRVRYIGPDGRERSKSFPDRQKKAAEDYLVTVESEKLRGAYIDPAAGRMTLGRYAKEWLAALTADELTRERLEREVRLHILPTLGNLPLSSIQPATVRSWMRRLHERGLSNGSRRVFFADLSMILNAAKDDQRIASNPCSAKTVRKPREEFAKVVPWTVDQLLAFKSVVRDRYRITVDLGAGCGLRQGEIFAVSPDDVDFDGQTLYLVRQIKLVNRRLIFALPKGGKVREVPLPKSVARALKAHAEVYAPIEATLPWGASNGEPRTVRLNLSTDAGKAVSRSGYNSTIWKAAIRAAGIEDTRRNGTHVLRHTYASVLLDAGESVKALSLYLGHADPGFTLRVYTHLLPSSEDRTRRAIDAVLGTDDDA
jgi:integrase